MSEISREDAIEMIEKEKAYMISHAGTFQVKCFDKAISDMEKLQKIDEILNAANKDPFIFRNAQYLIQKICEIMKGEND